MRMNHAFENSLGNFKIGNAGDDFVRGTIEAADDFHRSFALPDDNELAKRIKHAVETISEDIRVRIVDEFGEDLDPGQLAGLVAASSFGALVDLADQAGGDESPVFRTTWLHTLLSLYQYHTLAQTMAQGVISGEIKETGDEIKEVVCDVWQQLWQAQLPWDKVLGAAREGKCIGCGNVHEGDEHDESDLEDNAHLMDRNNDLETVARGEAALAKMDADLASVNKIVDAMRELGMPLPEKIKGRFDELTAVRDRTAHVVGLAKAALTGDEGGVTKGVVTGALDPNKPNADQIADLLLGSPIGAKLVAAGFTREQLIAKIAAGTSNGEGVVVIRGAVPKA
jgi:hypothetical protein